MRIYLECKERCLLDASRATLVIQEKARDIFTLSETEPLIQEKFAGPKGMVEGAQAAAVEQLLHEKGLHRGRIGRAAGVLTQGTSLKETRASCGLFAFARENGNRSSFVQSFELL